MRIHLAGRLLSGLLAVTASRLAEAAEPRPLTPDRLTEIAPVPALAAFATARQIPLAGISFAPDGSAPRAGDRVTLLLALRKGKSMQQWLAILETDDLTAKEEAMKPPPEDVIYTTTGLELHYVNSPAALRVELIGPFSDTTPLPKGPDDAAVPNLHARAVVSREYLNLGIAPYCRSALQIIPRTESAGMKIVPYNGRGSPSSAEDVVKGKRAAARIHLTPEEERLAFSVFFSLRTFFSAVMKVPAFQALLETVMNKPSAWSVASHLGLQSNFEYGWQDVRSVNPGSGGVEAPLYQLPVKVSLNGVPALKTTLTVTPPRPPLEACAGILALCVQHPTDESRLLFIRVLAAHPSRDEAGPR